MIVLSNLFSICLQVSYFENCWIKSRLWSFCLRMLVICFLFLWKTKAQQAFFMFLVKPWKTSKLIFLLIILRKVVFFLMFHTGFPYWDPPHKPKRDRSVLEEKSSFKMLGLIFSSKLDLGSYITSITKTASKKIGALIGSMKILTDEAALYPYKSTIHPCMEYCCHVWVGAPSCHLELVDKLQKRICRTVGPSLAASLEPLGSLLKCDQLKGYLH